MSKNCQSCGKELDDSAQFCDGCGASFVSADPNQQGQGNYAPPPPNQPYGQQQPPYGQQQPPYGQQQPNAGGAEEVFSPEDIEKNKTIAGLAYLIFFLPLVACPESRFARFHANQALVLLILFVASAIINVIPIIGCVISVIVWIFAIVVGIIGMINGFSGKAKRLPLIGKINIIK